MYDGEQGLGIPNILAILDRYSQIQVDRYEVRNKCEVPGLEYDLYLSSGGPGSPLEGDGLWDRAYYNLMDRLWQHNERSDQKKYAFFICHSFQMIANHLGLAALVLRNKESFGVYPVHMTEEGEKERIFQGLSNPFDIADFRKWQVIEKNEKRLENLHCKILALEKIRDHVPLERAIMAMRFSEEWIGTQFHPEADPAGMKYHFSKEDKKQVFIQKRGEEKYLQDIAKLDDKDGLIKTYKTILPSWLNASIEKINLQRKLEEIIHD